MRIEGLSVIYKIISPTGGIYIGQSINWSSRFDDYKCLNCKKQVKLYYSIKKYGWENHKVELLQYFPINEIDKAEINYILEYNSYCGDNEKGLNMTRGGKSVMLGRSHPKETLDKIANKKRGVKQSPEAIKKKVDSLSIPVIQYSFEGEFIKIWKSSLEAATELKLSTGSICDCIKGNVSHSGSFIWRKVEGNPPMKIERSSCKEFRKIKVTNLLTGVEDIVIGFNELVNKYNLRKDGIHYSLKNTNGLMPRKKLQIEIINN